jgi:hypothetical protein
VIASYTGERLVKKRRVEKVIVEIENLIDSISKITLLDKTVNAHEVLNQLVYFQIHLEKYQETLND